MRTISTTRCRCLRTPVEGDDPRQAVLTAVHEKERDDAAGDPAILCAFCGHIVTHPNERMEMRGSHSHVFANPHGLIFQIRCFRSAVGCGAIGPILNEFTWFSGFSWQAVMCRGCGEHLGWRFSSTGSVFYGLIADHLVEGALKKS